MKFKTFAEFEIFKRLSAKNYILQPYHFYIDEIKEKEKQMRKQLKAIHDYISYEDLFKRLGYKRYTPKLGSLGYALLNKSKHIKGDTFFKEFWDKFFTKLRAEEKRRKLEKQNSRHTLQSNVAHNTKASVTIST